MTVTVTAILGSVRPGSLTRCALKFVLDEVKSLLPAAKIHLVDPTQYKLTFPGSSEPNDHEAITKLVEEANVIILATPEYHGSPSSVLKCIIEAIGYPSPLKGKPVVSLGVGGGEMGAIKSLETISSVVHHTGGLVLPGSLSIANSFAVFDPNTGACNDDKVSRRLKRLAYTVSDYVNTTIEPRTWYEKAARDHAAGKEFEA